MEAKDRVQLDPVGSDPVLAVDRVEEGYARDLGERADADARPCDPHRSAGAGRRLSQYTLLTALH